MVRDRVRIVVVGAGDFGARHVATAAALEEIELVGVADRDAERAAAAVARYGGRPYADLAAALAAERPDAVVIATPPSAHFADLRRAVGQGIPVLVEKPVVSTAAEVDLLQALSPEEKALVYPAHVSRFLPSFVELRAAMADRRIRVIRAVRVVPAERVALHGDVHPALAAMVHDLDLIRALVAAPLEKIESEQAWTDAARPHPQSVVAHLRFSDGTIVSLDNTWTMPHSRQYIDARLEVHADGLTGFLTLPAGGVLLSDAAGDHRPDVELEAVAYGIPVGALATQLRHFAACAARRAVERAVSLDDALWSVRAALSIADQHRRR
ncbi:Gfo/Idh/MocA family protein [Microbacterium aurantiacum]|uniref:Gfo/Idh/MocA family protein n=1 Tax=Microbacterium aurantiacum TaxID=162393 RepID=UPI0034221EA3